MNKYYKFNQFDYQNNGGWCAGLSYSLMSYLHENKENYYRYITPDDAYIQSEEFLKIFKRTFDPIHRKETNFLPELRKEVRMAQAKNSNFVFSGKYTRDFSLPGAGIIALYVNPCGIQYKYKNGGVFTSSKYFFNQPAANHAGVIVWSPFKLFIFEPNCGGAIFNNNNQHNNIGSLLDECLEIMYEKCDRDGKNRVAQIKYIITPDEFA